MLGAARFAVICFGFLASLAHAEDLLFHYQRALAADPKFQGVQANRDATQERLSQARAGFLPTVNATATRNRNDRTVTTDSFIFSTPPGTARYSSSEYRLNLSQPIYNQALIAGYRVASADIDQAQAQFGAARQELMLRVAQAYFDVLLAQETLSLALAEKETLTQQLESVKARLNAGAASITEAHDTQARFQTVVAQEIEAQNQLDDKREALREITGESADTLASLGKEMPLISPDPPDMSRWVETATNQNLSLQAARAAAESARENVAQNRAGHYPTLSLVGSRVRNDADASIPGPGVRSDDTVVGLQLSVPIFQGGLINARTNEAAFRYEATRQDLEAKRRAVERSARAAFQGVTGGSAKIEAFQQTITAANSSLLAKTEGYRAGVYRAVDVLDATRDLFRTRRDYAEARHSYVLNLLQLKFAAGTLSDEDIVAINNWLRF